MPRRPQTTSGPNITPSLGALSIADFSRLYRVGRTTVWRERNAGRLKARRLGGKVMILVSDAQAWAAALPIAKGAR